VSANNDSQNYSETYAAELTSTVTVIVSELAVPHDASCASDGPSNACSAEAAPAADQLP